MESMTAFADYIVPSYRHENNSISEELEEKIMNGKMIERIQQKKLRYVQLQYMQQQNLLRV